MKRKKKKIVKQPIIENLGMDYTLDILPRTLEDNQFYYYDKKGVIRIGELLGVSELSKIGVFKLGEQIIKKHIYNLQDDFKNGLILMSPYSNNRYYCFNDYDNFVNAYNVNILKKKITSRKPVKYCVSNSSFFCKRTTQKLRDFKEFDNRANAVEYSRKGLITLFKNVKEFEEILNNASNELRNHFMNIIADNEDSIPGLRKFEVNFGNLNVGDNLLKADFIKEYQNEPLYYHFRKIAGDTLTVSECIGHRDKIIRLNDGSLLLNEDCRAYNPFIFKEENYEEVKQILKINNILEVKRYIESELRSLERVHRYCDVYEPFKKGVNDVWFSKFHFNAVSKALPIIVEKLKNNML